jgi:hypothetical protein
LGIYPDFKNWESGLVAKVDPERLVSPFGDPCIIVAVWEDSGGSAEG